MISNVEGESLPLASASKLSSATPSAGDTPATPPETGKQLLDRIIEERKKKLSHGLDFANAKSGKKKSKKETALASSNPCDISEIALESCSMRLNPVVLVSCTSLVLLFNVSKKDLQANWKLLGEGEQSFRIEPLK